MNAVTSQSFALGKVIGEIRQLIKNGLDINPPDDAIIRMANPGFGEAEIVEAIESLLSRNVTMGEKVERFESLFAEYIGSRHAIMVNSGSTANLLIMSVLTNPDYEKRIPFGSEVIVPALTWGTTLWPVIQMGCVPVLVDADKRTLCMDTRQVESAITPRTKAIFVAHILGNSVDMNAIMEIAEKHGLVVIEDACESLGTTYEGVKVGTIGELGSYSFFFSHHITTIEGGMIVTNDDKVADLLRALRAHGWTRHLHDKSIESEYPDIDPRFMFCNVGYSVRPTEIQGAFGIHQLKKLDAANSLRKLVAWNIRKELAHLSEHLDFTEATFGTDHTWFGFPIILKEDYKKDLCDYLGRHLIDTRPIIAGNLAAHPALEKFDHVVHGELNNAQEIMNKGFYIGSHPDMTDSQVARLARVMTDFFEGAG